jgi:hypothetical protein
MTTLMFANPGHLLPTLPGKVTGVVAHESPKTWTVQCQVCFRTGTGHLIFAVNWANFTPDEGHRGTTGYRRCIDCQRAGRHRADQPEQGDQP